MSSVRGATLIVALASGLSAAFTMALPLGPLAPNDEQPETMPATRQMNIRTEFDLAAETRRHS
jgi:hypothetical protein